MREYKGLMSKMVFVFLIGLALYHILKIVGVYQIFRLPMYALPYRAGSLTLTLFLTFLLYPATKQASKDRLPWYDILLMLAGIVPCIYVLLFSDKLLEARGLALYSVTNVILFLVLFVSTLEATRRTGGIAVAIFVVIFFLHPLVQSYLPGFLGGRSVNLFWISNHMLASSNEGFFGIVSNVTTGIIIMFTLFGQFLVASGTGKFFIDVALAMVGHMRGGPAKVAVIASSLLGMLSGSTTANVATVGVMTIPMMKKVGYTPHFACAVEAVSSNGGQIMPPVMGVTVFVMAEVTGIPYFKLCIAAILPAILYYFALFVQVDREAARTGMVPLSRKEMPSLRETFKRGWYHLIPLISLIYLLVVPKYSPEKCALYSIGVLILVNLFKKETRFTPKKIAYALAEGAKGFLMIASICAAVGIIISSVAQTGLGIKLSTVLIDISGGHMLLLLILTAVACYILGMGLSSTPIYIMMVALTAPVLKKMGVDVLPAHMFVLWMALTSFITPPVALAVLVACAIGGGAFWKTGFAAMRLAICTYILPFVWIYSPGFLLMDTPINVAHVIIKSSAGVFSLACGVSGYMLVPTRLIERIGLIIAGLLLIVPGLVTDGVGAVLILVIWFVQKRRVKRRVDIIEGGESVIELQ